jgi:DNA-binding NarL/FixJ family response regulator
MRVVLGEDSVLLRESVAKLLERHDFEVVGTAGDEDGLMREVRAHRPEVAIVDIRMPPTHTDEGIRAARAIRAELPETGVLVLSQYAEEECAYALLGDGTEGLGYLLKDGVSEVQSFLDAVRRVARGGTALAPEVVAQLLDRGPGNDPLAVLTGRERDVLALMAEGLTNEGIAARLQIGERAVEHHVTGIFDKLLSDAAPGEHRRVLAVLRYLESTA